MTRTKEEILHEIKSVMEKYINNTVAQHGGMVEIKDFDMETGKLTMMMKGACSGCAGSTATLKKGIESTMKHYIPEVKTVEGEDDPNSDVKPYYEYNPWDGPDYATMLDALNTESDKDAN